jgi:hypothetical protein
VHKLVGKGLFLGRTKIQRNSSGETDCIPPYSACTGIKESASPSEFFLPMY